MFFTATYMALSFLLISLLLLLEVDRLWGFVLAIKFSFARIVFVLGFVGLEISLLYQIGTGIPLMSAN